jgi:NAD(P)-dependent dehydrogenase (short-subunit alcohol dehydrogenase family)
VLALTKSLGKELATTGILVNAIAPAAVRTAILDQMSPGPRADHDRQEPHAAPGRAPKSPRW